MSDPPDNDAAQRTPIQLPVLSRWLLGIIGVAGLGSGVAAVFTRDVEAGPVALIVVGAFFLLIAMGGVLPARLKIGDNEAEFVAAGRALARTVEEASPPAKVELTAAVERLSVEAPRLAQPALAGLAYESMVVDMIKVIVDSDPELGVGAPSGERDYGFDALVTGQACRNVAVDVKTGTLDAASLQRFMQRLQTLRETHSVDRLLIVHRGRPTVAALTASFLNHGISFVEVEGPEHRERLYQALRAATGLA